MYEYRPCFTVLSHRLAAVSRGNVISVFVPLAVVGLFDAGVILGRLNAYSCSNFNVSRPTCEDDVIASTLLLLSVKCNFDRLSNHFGFCLSVCLSTDLLSNDYVRNSLPIFTKFCMPLRNVVVSNSELTYYPV